MGTPVQHQDIPDAKRHEPKGASSAAINTTIFSNGDGTTSFRAIDWSDVGGTPTFSAVLTEALDASSYANQTISVANTPTQINFGAAITNDDVTLDAAGKITFLTAGTYVVIIELLASKLGGTSATRVFFRETVNGSTIGHASEIRFRGSEVDGVRQVNFHTVVEAAANDYYEIWFATDTANNTGFITEAVPPAIGWHTDTASTHVHVYKFGA